MNSGMTSRRRILNALERRPVDHVPLLLRFWSLGGNVDHIPFNWRDEVLRVQSTTLLGLDDTLLLEPPLGYVENYLVEQVPGVVSYTEVIPKEKGEQYPLLTKVYITPKGPLQTTIRMTEDWPRGKDIHLFDDHNISRLKEPLIKTKGDIQRLEYLLRDPSNSQIAEFQERAKYSRLQAQRLGVVLDGGWVALGDAAMWLCGMERILYGQTDEPDFIDYLLETIFAWEMMRVDLLLSERIDVLVHMAWYETTDFWTPSNYRRFLKPRLMKFIEKAHQKNAKFRYIMTKGSRPYWKDFLDMGIDCLTGVDPVQDRLDLKEIKLELGSRICLMGGINSAVMLSQWSDEEIRQAVNQAMRDLAPGGGFIMYPVDAIFNIQSWEKVLLLIDHWKEVN